MTGASGEDVEPRSIKMGLVEEIKNLPSELHRQPLAWFEDLLARKIDIEKPGPRDGISSQVAIGPWRRPRKSTRIKPKVWSSQLLSGSHTRTTFCNSRRGIVAEAWVQVGTVGRPPVPIRRPVRSVATGQRFPCTERADSINGPAAQNRSHGSLLEAEWNGISGGEDKIVPGVEGGTPPVAALVQEIHHSVWFLACFAAGDR